MLSYDIPGAAFRRLTRSRLGLAVAGASLASAVGAAIWRYDCQLLLFVIIAFGVALIQLAWLRSVWRSRPPAEPARLEYLDGRLQWHQGDRTVAGGLRSVFAYPDHLLIVFGTAQRCEVPLQRRAAAPLLEAMRADAVAVQPMDGPVRVLGILALAGVGLLIGVIALRLWVAATALGFVGALIGEWT